MYSFRRTRKRGGVGVSTVLECVAPFESATKCVSEFLKQYNFMRIKVPGDGNCFYHTLHKYYELSHLPGSPKAPTHLEIRDRVVDKMEENINEVKDVLLINMNNINNNAPNANVQKMTKYLQELESLREDGVWNSDTADLVSQFAARALNLKIKIYDIKHPVASRKILLRREISGKQIYQNRPAENRKIICYTFEPEMNNGTVNMLRVSDSHYELLYPKDAPVARPKSKRATIKKSPKNIINNTVNKISTMKLNKRMNKSPNRRVPFTRSKARELKVGSPPKSKSLENALLKIALQESKESKKQQKISNRFFNTLSFTDV